MMAAALLAGWSAGMARAEVVANYTESFDNLDVSKHDFAPKGWGHIVDSYEDWYETYYVEYANPATGGQAGAYLEAGSQSLGSSWSLTDVYDLLVTPAVTGNVTFYVKLTKAGGTFTVYTCTKDEQGEFSRGAAYVAEVPELSTDAWTQVTLPAVPAGTYLGFRLDEAAIDEFAAASADVVLKSSLEITDVTLVGGEDELLADEQNAISFTLEAIVRNNGEVDLTPGMDNYSVSVVINSLDDELVTTQDIAVSLAVGAETTLTIPVTYTLNLEEGETEFRESFYVKENLTGTSEFVDWITGIPYIGILQAWLAGESGALESTDVLDFGIVRDAPYSLLLEVRNDGAKPIRLTGIALPEGFTYSPALPLDLQPGADKDTITLTLGTSVTGDRGGQLTLTCDDGTTFAVNVAGLVLDAEAYYEDFEDETLPAGMIAGDSWKLSKDPYEAQTDQNKQWMEHGTSSNPTRLILPKLVVAEGGETLSFRAAKRAANSTLYVSYSADRQEWTRLDTLDVDDFTNDKPEGVYGGYDNFAFSWFSVDLPEGEWYVAFESGYARLDDIYGCKLAEVAHDLYLTGSELPATATVNSTYTATASVLNVASQAEAAESYTATLYVDGQVVATADNTTEWAAGETRTFTFSYTPHAAGAVQAYIEVALADDYKLATPETTVTVAEEVFTSDYVVGTPTAKAFQQHAPLRTYNEKSASETIYPASVLSGLESGTKILGIAYNGYTDSRFPVATHIRVWMECTQDAPFAETITARNTDEMTLLYDSDYELPKVGSAEATAEIMHFVFTELFTYTGGNLRVVIESISDAWGNSFFETDQSVSNTSIWRGTDGENLADEDWALTDKGMPVVRLQLEAEAPAISGKVTDAETGEALAGATVTFTSTSGNVLYTGTTNDAGEYNVPILKQEYLIYNATVVKEGYLTLEKERAVMFSLESMTGIDFQLQRNNTTGLPSAEADGLLIASLPEGLLVQAAHDTTVQVHDVAGRLVRRMDVQAGQTWISDLTPGLYIVNGQKAVVR